MKPIGFWSQTTHANTNANENRINLVQTPCSFPARKDGQSGKKLIEENLNIFLSNTVLFFFLHTIMETEFIANTYAILL